MTCAGNVLAAIQQQGVGPVTVAPGAADLLVISFWAVRHVQVDDEAHIGPVDPHPEGDGRHHHHCLPAAEPGQRHPLLHGRQPGVERHSHQTLRLQPCRHSLRLGPAAAIHDPGLALVPGEKGEQLLQLRGLSLGGDVQVCPVKAGAEHLSVFHAERIKDVAPGPGVRGGGQGDARHAGERMAQPRQAAILRTELMPPGGYAMRLVYGDQGNLASGQPFQGARHQQPLG